ncbi:ATP-dependent dethiobiotin synthetase BioD [Campylobacter upsaliensis]|uniref:ATP-dependent dethiobiotin synthetase BioD n=1 Tax=Campylobacter upsaliensis TaxID=28080 RepID=UPI0022EA73AF|nr:ATP-dependent dethiobiotin synthetase BioD [Campylobacter upsaliensis]MEB2805492.1 ATP-dependent dethiobiotin synthetase BioD [Campylobacter upsaliensis]
MQIYISGIHTDAGKTHFSAVFCANLNYDYFKLIQAGTPKDSDLIAKLSPKTRILKEGFFLKTPISPHLAKIKEKANYQAFSLQIPNNENLLIELAGGLFTPLDEKHTMIDFMQRFQKPTILVGRYYLGSINHILLSIEALKMRQIPILFLAMMGEKEPLQDEFIQNHTQIPIINLNFYNAKNIENEEFKRQIKALLRV